MPVIIAVEDRQRLDDVELQEVEWWEAPHLIVESVDEYRQEENCYPTDQRFAKECYAFLSSWDEGPGGSVYPCRLLRPWYIDQPAGAFVLQ